MLRAAFATWRANLGSGFLVLGLLSAVWAAPYLIVEPLLSAEGPSVQRTVLFVLNSLWWAPLMGGQILFSLEACREGAAPIRRLRDGVAFTGHLAALILILTLVHLPFELMAPAGSDAEPGLLDVMALVWTVVLIVAYTRLGFALTLVVDATQSVPAALRASWTLSKGRSWLIVRLGAAFVFAGVPLVVAAAVHVAVAVALMLLLLYPPMMFAWTHLYIALRNERERGH